MLLGGLLTRTTERNKTDSKFHMVRQCYIMCWVMNVVSSKSLLMTICHVVLPDPVDWTEIHVKHWINWAIEEFQLVGVTAPSFHLTGKELCEMQHSEFVQKVPHDKGDVFWTHLELLRKCKFVGRY